MDIKLITLDLDGTLLDSKKHLPEANRKALSECIEKGIWIVPCTGRTLDGISQEVKEIPGIKYTIATNGAMIHDLENKTVLDTRLLPWERALEILEFVDKYPVMYDPYIDGRGITESRFFDNLFYYGLTEEIQELVRKTRDTHPNIIEYVKTARKPVEKINIFFSDPQIGNQLKEELKRQPDLSISSSISNNIEINALGASKGEALYRLAELLGIDRTQTMAMGDGENDFSMIHMAGVGVAMKNSIKPILEEADYITETNDDAGVAVAIYRLVLGKEL